MNEPMSHIKSSSLHYVTSKHTFITYSEHGSAYIRDGYRRLFAGGEPRARGQTQLPGGSRKTCCGCIFAVFLLFKKKMSALLGGGVPL